VSNRNDLAWVEDWTFVVQMDGNLSTVGTTLVAFYLFGPHQKAVGSRRLE